MPIPDDPAEIELPLQCNECGTEGSTVTRFAFLSQPNKEEEFLCWDCRKSYLEQRFEGHGGGEEEPSGQVTLGDFQ